MCLATQDNWYRQYSERSLLYVFESIMVEPLLYPFSTISILSYHHNQLMTVQFITTCTWPIAYMYVIHKILVVPYNVTHK